MFRKPSKTREVRSQRCLHAVLLALALVCHPAALQAESEIRFRNWTNPNGGTVRAKLVGLVNGQVQLRQLNDGSIIELKLKALQPDDQAYVEERAHLVWRRDTVAWPNHLRPMREFRVEEAQAGRSYIYNSDHFTMRSDVRLAPDLVREYAAVFESTHYALESLPLGLQPEKPSSGRFKVRFFRRHDDFQNAGGDLEMAAIYLKQSKEILIPLASLGVKIVGEQVPLDPKSFNPTPLKHELTHQLMHNWLDLLPVWFAEGMAEYVSAVPFSDGEFDFTRIDQGIKAHLSSRFGLLPSPPESSSPGVYTIHVLPPAQLMALDYKDWSRARGATAELNYRSAFLLIYYFIHLDGDGSAGNLVEYLRTARMDSEEQAQFVEDYNEAARDFNQRLQTYTDEKKRYFEARLKLREEAEAYNRRVDRYNEQLRANVPADQLIHPGPPPVPPVQPKQPEVPEILEDDPKNSYPLNLKEIEQRARAKLLANRTVDQLWTHMKTALGRQKLMLSEGAASVETVQMKQSAY